jgi:hypothetical protein
MIEMHEELYVCRARGIFVLWPINDRKFTTSLVIFVDLRGYDEETGKEYRAFYNVVRSRTRWLDDIYPAKNESDEALFNLSEQRAYEKDLLDTYEALPLLEKPRLRRATSDEIRRMGYPRGRKLRFQFGRRLK